MRKALPILSMLFLLGLFTSSHAVAGAIFYVDNSGSPACANTGGQSGSQAAPFCSIQYGISRLAGGDTLYVKNGTYAGDFSIFGPSGTAAAHTVIAAFPTHAPVISGPGISNGRMKITGGCSYIDFIGFTITNHNQGLYLDDDAGTKAPCDHLTIDGITIHDVGQEGIAIRAGSATGPRNHVIKDSLIYNTGRLGPSQNGEGIYVGNSSGTDNTNTVTILNNTIHDTPDECIELKGDSHDVIVDGNNLSNCITPGSSFGSTGGAIEIDEPRNSATSPNHIIRNNVIHDIPVNNGIVKRGIRVGTGATIYNNVLYNINVAHNCVLSNSANYPRVIYNNTIDCTTGNALVNSGTTVTSANNIGPNTTNNSAISSAFFVNYAGHDYHLVSGAAVVNAGLDLRATVPVDKDGITRDATPDRGAYEYANVDKVPPAAPVNLRVQ